MNMEKNLNNYLSKFFKEVNKNNAEFDSIQDLFEYISKRLEMDDFKCHQQFSFSLNNTMIVFQKVEYINNLTITCIINVIIEEENLKVKKKKKSEVRSYNEIIF